MTEPYRDSIEHLVDELKRIDLLVRRAMIVARSEQPKPDGEFRGFVISEPDIDEILESGGFFQQHWMNQEGHKAKLEPIDQKLQELRKAIDERREVTANSGRRLTLAYLAEGFGLSAAEVDLVLIALAPELEPRYETLYAYLQDDVTRKRPGVNLALNLICRSEREKLFGRRYFTPGSPLTHFRMIELIEEAHDRESTLLRKFMKVDEALLRYLLEHSPTRLALGSFIEPRATIDGLEVDEATQTKLRNLIVSLQRTGVSNTIVQLTGSSRDELRAAAEAIAQDLRKKLIYATTAELENAGSTVNAMIRDATLLDAAIAVMASEQPGNEQQPKPTAAVDQQIWRSLGQASGPVIAMGPDGSFPDLPGDARVWRVELEAPSYRLRRHAWESALGGTGSDIDTARLADTFRFGGASIRQASTVALSLASLRNPSDPKPNLADVLAAGRTVSGSNLQRYAVAVQPRYTWKDIVLPEEKLQQLRHIAARFEHRRTVHQDWGFGEKLSRGKGLTFLFTGQSGVGKTMAAEVLANSLSLELYQIDLSTVVSKYIGETEKNLSAIFREAEMSQSLLFFDEADSLFGKRTEVKDAHDRYANLEVNYLLQRIEQFEGMVILATNLQRNLDEAFLRRMQDVVDFPMPDEKLRERIWRQHLPDDAPKEDNIDFSFLAHQFKLTGGNIKNAVMSAAYLAALKEKKIGMAEMVRGVSLELQKQGKLVLKTDFGKHFETARG
jgi:SpoVK/Ycf46/Vps4 family AAA+-type ATPase